MVKFGGNKQESNAPTSFSTERRYYIIRISEKPGGYADEFMDKITDPFYIEMPAEHRAVLPDDLMVMEVSPTLYYILTTPAYIDALLEQIKKYQDKYVIDIECVLMSPSSM